jgi:glycosyltransferase involved in cell wall biosynthesis
LPTHLAIMDLTPDKRGSFENYVVRLAARLKADGWRSIAGFWGRPPDWLTSELASAGAEVLVLNEEPELRARAGWPAGWERDLRLGRTLKRIAGTVHPDVVHLHFCVIYSLLPFALRWGGARHIVATEHISLPVIRRSLARDLPARLRNRLCLGLVDRVLAVSGFVRHRLIVSDHAPAEKVSVLYNGVDGARFSSGIDAGTAAATRSRLGLRPDDAVATCVAQLIDAKGVRHLIDAAALLREQPNLVVLIVGEGERREALQAQVTRLGLTERVRLLGLRDDVAEILGISDLFVCPSVWDEALGFVNLEAMAAGVPVIATRMGGIPEAVRDGETGLLVPPGDPEALAAAIASLAGDPARRRQMAGRARRLVEDVFSIERAIEDTVALYRGLLRRRESPALAAPPAIAGPSA